MREIKVLEYIKRMRVKFQRRKNVKNKKQIYIFSFNNMLICRFLIIAVISIFNHIPLCFT